MNNNTIGEKIRIARTEMNLTQEELADLLKTGATVVWRWENGEAEPRMGAIRKLAKIFKKTVAYFLVETTEYQPVNEVMVVPDSNMIKLPVLARIPAGLPEWSEEDVEAYIHIPRFMYPGATLAIYVKSDSMEPGIMKGDIAVLNSNKEIINKKVVLAQCSLDAEKGWCLKRIKIQGGKTYLASDNTKYAPFLPKELKIIGTVIGIQRKYENGGGL